MRLDFLRPLYEGTGDYASVYLDASRTTEDAAELVALRWRAAREHLADGGADQATLGALEELVTSQEHSVPGLAAFAQHGEVAFTTRDFRGRAGGQLAAGGADVAAPLARLRGRRGRGRAVPSVRRSRSRVRAASSSRETCICEMPSRLPISACVILP